MASILEDASAWTTQPERLKLLITSMVYELNQDRLKEVCDRRGIDAPRYEYGGRDYVSGLLTHMAELDDLMALAIELCLVGTSLAVWGDRRALWDTCKATTQAE